MAYCCPATCCIGGENWMVLLKVVDELPRVVLPRTVWPGSPLLVSRMLNRRLYWVWAG